MKHLLPEAWQRSDILREYAQQVDFGQLSTLRAERWQRLLREHWQPVRALLRAIPLRSELEERGAYSVATNQPFVRFGTETTLQCEESVALNELLSSLMPWRKGPFSLCGIEVDAEWRSDFKWQRLEPYLPELQNKLIADIGCSNGYYMLRMLEHEPAGVMGIDPSEKFLFAFELFQRLGQFANLQYELLGVEEMHLFDRLFDVVFCCGILYHHRNPLQLLSTLYTAMRAGGTLLVESQAIPGELPVAFCPAERYAKARNVYFVPTAQCIASWLRKTGFRDIEICSSVPLSLEEQRRTKWMQFESLADFLDPEDQTKTIEGYPAPWRTIVRASK